MPSPKSQPCQSDLNEMSLMETETEETQMHQSQWTPVIEDHREISLTHPDQHNEDGSTQIVEFSSGSFVQGDEIIISQESHDASGSSSSHNDGVNYVQQFRIVQIESSSTNPGEIQLFQFPLSLLSSNFQSQHAHLQSQVQDNGPLQLLQHDPNPPTANIEPEGASDTEEKTLVKEEVPEKVENDQDQNKQKEQESSKLSEPEKQTLNILTRPKRLRTKNRYINNNKTLEKLVNQNDGPKSESNKSTEPDLKDRIEKEQDKHTEAITTTEPAKPEPFPKDRCANCLKIFEKDEQKCANISKSYPGPNSETDVNKFEISIMKALNVIFQIPKEEQAEEEEYCLCKKCANILQILYSAYEDFTELTQKEAYVLKKLKEVSEAVGARMKRIGAGKKRKQADPKKAGGDELIGSQIDDEIDWDDEEDDELITGDVSDDEDFEPPPDLADVGAASSSSSSEEETFFPIKKKKPQKSRRSKNLLEDSIFWNTEIKQEPFSSDEELGAIKPKRQLKNRFSKASLRGLTYDCNLCDESCEKPRDLRKHLQDFHKKTHSTANDAIDDDIDESEDKKPLISNVLSENSDLNSSDSFSKCRLCGAVFQTGTDLKHHFAVIHEGELPYKCTKCDRSFADATALRKHTTTHDIEKPYKCPGSLCEMAFRRAYDLRRHWIDKHVQDDIPEVSDPPGAKKGRKSSGQKQKVKRAKVEKTVLPCSVCGKGFVRQDHLKLHMRVHTGEKPFPCNVCGKAFSDPRGLAYHEVTHSNERPYCCTICGMTFKRLHHLNDHERNHREDVERPFGCEICGKCFKYKKHLNSHMVIHGDTKDHQCDICGKAFNRKDNLRQHVKKVHGKEPGPSTMSFSVTSTTSGPLAVTTSSPSTTSITTQALPIDPGLGLVYMTL